MSDITFNIKLQAEPFSPDDKSFLICCSVFGPCTFPKTKNHLVVSISPVAQIYFSDFFTQQTRTSSNCATAAAATSEAKPPIIYCRNDKQVTACRVPYCRSRFNWTYALYDGFMSKGEK